VSAIAGGVAGISIDFALFPVDSIKTRLQVMHFFLLNINCTGFIEKNRLHEGGKVGEQIQRFSLSNARSIPMRSCILVHIRIFQVHLKK
jgi:hypothetical protein